MEARPTLYKRPTSFTSQAKLFAWIDGSREQDLRRVRTLTLRLTDIDLSSLLDRQTSSSTRIRGGVWALYQYELELFDDACKTLPNLSSLIIVPPKAGRSQLLKGLYLSFLALIPQRYPKLKHLEIQDGDDILDAVPILRNLADVKCTGGPLRSGPRRRSRDASTEKSVGEDERMDMDGEEGATGKPSSRRSTSVSRKGRRKADKAESRRRPKHVVVVDALQ